MSNHVHSSAAEYGKGERESAHDSLSLLLSKVYHRGVCKAEFDVMELEPFDENPRLPCGLHSFLFLECGPAPLPKMVVMALRGMIERVR
jgi:hypothetical protein